MRVANHIYAVFFDTNIVKGKNWIDHNVRQQAGSIGDDTIITIELYLPEVVQKEWSRYYTRYAKTQYDKVSEASKTLVDMSFEALSVEKFDQDKVNKNSKKFLKDLGFIFVPTPHDAIEYKELVELAIKHEPPFAPGDGSDKGLKDAIIAHTIKDFSDKNKDKKIVFIGRDGLMATYLRNIMPAKSSLTIYDSIEKFAEELKLTNNNLGKELAQGATEAFFVQDVNKTFYYSLGIRDLLINKYRSKIVDAEAAKKHLIPVKVNSESNVLSSIKEGQWSLGLNQILVPDSVFDKKEDLRLYWTVDLDFIQNYDVTIQAADISTLPTSYIVKHIVVYKLLWSAELSDEGELINPAVELLEELIESQTIKRVQSSIATYDALKELLNLDTLASTGNSAADIGSKLTTATDTSAGSISSLSEATWLKDISNIKVPDISSQLSALKSIAIPTIPTNITLDTKPPTLDTKLPTLDIRPKIVDK